jgi:cytochrome c biogenesis protein CcmG, thiol:disulfide interchange protein DsbE
MKTGDRPKAVTLADLTGATVSLPEAYTGKVVIVHFWASWCPPCLKEIDALEALFGQYRERGLVPVSVNVGEAQARVVEALASRKVTYPILLDADSAVARPYGVTGIPTTFILERNGTIQFKVLGEIGRSGLHRIVTGLF